MASLVAKDSSEADTQLFDFLRAPIDADYSSMSP